MAWEVGLDISYCGDEMGKGLDEQELGVRLGVSCECFTHASANHEEAYLIQ